MNMKKYAAFAVAMVMAVSGLAVLSASFDSQAAESSMEAGDTWGMGASINEKQLISYLLRPEMDDDVLEYPLTDESGEGITDKARLIEYIKAEAAEEGITLEVFDLSASFGQYMYFEVAYKDANGYVFNFAISMLLKANVKIKGNAEVFATDVTVDFDDTIMLGTIMLGTVSTDADLMVKKISVTTDFFMTFKGDNELIVDGEELPEKLADYSGTFDARFVVGYDSITKFNEGESFKLFPEIGDTSYPVTVNTKLYSHAFMFGEGDSELITLFKDDDGGFVLDDLFDDTFFEGFDFNLSLATFTQATYSSIIVVERDIDEIEYEFGGVGIVTPLVGNDIEIKFGMDDDDDEDDDFSMRALFGDGLIYESGFALTGDNIGKVKGGVSKTIRAFEDAFYGKDVEVKISADEKYTKKFGQPIGAYGGKVPEGKVLVGWNVGQDVIVDDGVTFEGMYLLGEDFILKSNVEATPVFATEYTLEQLTADDFNVGDGLIYVKVGDDEETFQIPQSVLTAIKGKNGVLVIEGPDYKWVLTGDNLGVGATLNPVIKGKQWQHAERFKSQNVVQLSFSANGYMPDGTKVTYDSSGKFTTGALVDVYIMGDDDSMEFVGSYSVNGSGKVEFDVPHCSEYVLVQNSLPTQASADAKGEFPLLLVAVAAGVAIAAIAVVFYIRK